MWSGRFLQEGRREGVRVEERWMQPRDLQRGIVVVGDSTLVDSVAVVMSDAVEVSVVVVVVLVTIDVSSWSVLGIEVVLGTSVVSLLSVEKYRRETSKLSL